MVIASVNDIQIWPDDARGTPDSSLSRTVNAADAWLDCCRRLAVPIGFSSHEHLHSTPYLACIHSFYTCYCRELPIALFTRDCLIHSQARRIRVLELES